MLFILIHELWFLQYVSWLLIYKCNCIGFFLWREECSADLIENKLTFCIFGCSNQNFKYLIMKRTSSYLSVIVLALTFLTVSSCEKEGPVGPAGPTGATGATGATGPAGPAGANGKPGSVNLIASSWLDLGFQKDAEDNVFFAGIDVPEITAEILAKGDVRVFINLNTPDDPTIVPLPYTGIGDTVKITFFAFPGGIEVDSNIDASTGETKDKKKVLQYRYVIIPNTVTARTSVDWNNYEEVKEYLQLKD
jgi:hypothetical protein